MITDVCITVFGIQHWYLTKIVLLSYNPRAVLFGPQRQRYMTQVNVRRPTSPLHCCALLTDLQSDITDALRHICSIGHSNQHFHNATVIACLALSMCGDRFQSRLERDAAEDILNVARVTRGVPTTATLEQLRRQWL